MFLMMTMVISGYLSGSVPFGKIIARFYSIDIQTRGSGNIGFANVLRVIGWKAAIPTLLLDVLKGFIPTYVALFAFGANFAFLVGITAVIGHIFPVWLKGRGGKGIATSLGVLLACVPFVGILGFSVYVIASLVLKKSSHASITAGICVFIASVALYPAYAWAVCIMLLIALWALRNNLFGTVPNYDT